MDDEQKIKNKEYHHEYDKKKYEENGEESKDNIVNKNLTSR